MLKIHHFQPVVWVLLSSLLAACTGTDQTTGLTPTPASENYVVNQGNTAPAQLSDEVGAAYSNTLSTANTVTLSSADILSRNIAAISGASTLNAADFSSAVAETESGTCENTDGHITVTRDVDATTQQGYMDVTLQNCLSDDTYLDGMVTVNVYAYDEQTNQPTSIGFTYHNLKITQGATELTLTGSLDAQQNIPLGTSRSTIDVYMRSETEQGLVQIVIDTTANDATVSTAMDGKVCMGATGCAEVETITSVLMSYFTGVQQGAIIMQGANGSSINLSTS